MAIMGLSRTVSEIKGNFSRKLQIFPTTGVFSAPVKNVPIGIEYRRLATKI